MAPTAGGNPRPSFAEAVVDRGQQPVINMVTGGGFLNFDSEAGVNVSVREERDTQMASFFCFCVLSACRV